METNNLSKREIQVLQCMRECLTMKESAKKLCISYHTAQDHSRSLKQKLDVRCNIGAVLRGIELGIINL